MKRRPRAREATPVAHMFLSKRMVDHKPHDVICELVDNSLDADAKRVWIELGRRSITVADDGGEMEEIDNAIRFGKGTRLVVEDMDPGALTDVIEYDGDIEGMPYPVYGGLMTQRSVVYNRAFIGYAYRFVEETTELVKGLSTAHLQVFLGEEWKECLGTHKNRLERRREELFEDIRAQAKDWLATTARFPEPIMR